MKDLHPPKWMLSPCLRMAWLGKGIQPSERLLERQDRRILRNCRLRMTYSVQTCWMAFRWESERFGSASNECMQLIHRQEASIPSPGKHGDLAAVVPHAADGPRHTDEVPARRYCL